jgi:hypothetical protein
VEAELFHAAGLAGGRTHMTKLIAAFHNFANVPKNRQAMARDRQKWRMTALEAKVYNGL